MSDAFVKVEDISKKFCRNLKRSLWYGVRDLGSELTGRSSGRKELRKEEFWALKGVSFRLHRGETLGIIGHNGAGKTTLLRMLNGLIRPDTGHIEIRGRMQALIALGAGFNPVLTGRENVYINAAVLGLSKSEIGRRFDQIVDFSGIEEFIDMPVQSYSSGMVVRLGFSVAAHLEPDVLLVDEVLAVGDLAFRTKCHLRIKELRDRGVAIILVSHDLHTVNHVCSRAITLSQGQIIYVGDTGRAIDAYRASLIRKSQDPDAILRAGTGEIKITSLQILNVMDEPGGHFQVGATVKLRLFYQVNETVKNPIFNVVINVLYGQQVTGIRSDVDDIRLETIEGQGYVEIVIPNLNLLPNVYTMDAVILHADGITLYDRLSGIAHLVVVGGHAINGTSYLPHSWQVNGGQSRLSAPGQESQMRTDCCRTTGSR